jgi:hypothetical protein
MNETVKLLYRSYLGKNLSRRMVAIWTLVEQHEGRKFFDRYSTPNDSILDYLKKADEILNKHG